MGAPSCHTGTPETLVASGPGSGARADNCACGFYSPPGARFCGGCGMRLKARFQFPVRTGGTVLAPPVAAANPSRQVTVLLADIVDSTKQIAQLAPEQAMHRLQPAITLMCDAVECL